jgi:ElaB/YqjD/DUF883 family membrane-anchored ribosome-binding protein
MAPTYNELLEAVNSLKKENEDLKAELEKVRKENRERLKGNKKRLENCARNCTSTTMRIRHSANKHLKSNTYRLHARGGKGGAPVGHEGVTRE